MVIDQEIKRRIMDLYFNEHKAIREIARITKKTSRDITPVLRNSEYKGKGQGNEKSDGSDARQLSQEKEDTAHEYSSIPLNTKAYRFFSEGKKPIEVAIILKLSEADATKFHLEFLRLSRLPELPFIYEKLRGPQGISYFLSLCKLALAERMTTKNVLKLLKMANDCRLYDIENKIENYKEAIAQLRLHRSTKGQELYALNNKIASAESILSQYELAFGKMNKEFNRICEQINGMKSMVEQFKVNNKVYQNIYTVAEEKVKSFLGENNAMKLLEFALAAVTEALRQDPQSQLIIEKTPPIQNYDFISSSLALEQPPFPSPYDDYPHFATEKVLELSNKYYNRLVKGLTDCSMSTAAGMGGC
ncbi:MAG: hypothetical protein ACR2IS_04845 [Nitrososphaeraceae archaeon]